MPIDNDYFQDRPLTAAIGRGENRPAPHFGDAEVPAKVENVERTDRSRHGNEVKSLFSGEEHSDVADHSVVKADPEIGLD